MQGQGQGQGRFSIQSRCAPESPGSEDSPGTTQEYGCGCMVVRYRGGRPCDHEAHRNGLVREALPPSTGHRLRPHFKQNLSPECFVPTACHSCFLCPQLLDQCSLALVSAWGRDKGEKCIKTPEATLVGAVLGHSCPMDPVLCTPTLADAMLGCLSPVLPS